MAPRLPEAPAQPVELKDPESPLGPILGGAAWSPPASVTSCLSLATEYLASYKISQLSINALISGLQYSVEGLSALKAPLRNIQRQEVGMESPPRPPWLERTATSVSLALSGTAERIRKLQRRLRAVRRAGARRAAVSRQQGIGRDSVIGAVAEALCVNFFLSLVGLRLTRRSVRPGQTGVEAFEDIMEKFGEIKPPASKTLFRNQTKKPVDK